MGEDDRVLVERALAGEGSAFEELVRRYHAKVYRLAFRLMRDPEKAQDVLQETFLTVHRKLASFRFESAFGTWLYRVAYNTALMRLRKERSEPEAPLDDSAAADPASTDLDEGADEILARRESLERIRAAVDRLPESYRTVILLRDVEELSTEEVAELMETTPAAIKTRLHRARLALRAAIAKDPP